MKDFIKSVVYALIIASVIKIFFFLPFFVEGSSMEPNFYDGDYLIVKELGYRKNYKIFGFKIFSRSSFKQFSRGDVVVFEYPKNPSKDFIKRVVGLPGEKVIIEDNKIKIINKANPDGFYLSEKEYLPNYVKTENLKVKEFDLGAGEYVVLGDNRENSSDSRAWGKLSQDFVIGKVVFQTEVFKSFKEKFFGWVD